MSEQNPQPENQNGRIVLIVLGAVMIVVGLSNLGRWGFDGWSMMWRPFGGFFGWAGDWAFPALVIVGGILLIVFSNKAEGKTFRMPSKSDRLYRSRKEHMLAGVLGGLAEYFAIDPTLLRLGVVATALLTEVWPVLVVYVAAAIIVPEAPQEDLQS